MTIVKAVLGGIFLFCLLAELFLIDEERTPRLCTSVWAVAIAALVAFVVLELM